MELLQAAGLPTITRSSGASISDETEVLLIDTLGELAAFTGLASVVFIGGSLVPHGGHNPLEALVFGKPVLTGPHTDNFATLYRDMEKARLVTRIEAGQDLAEATANNLTTAARDHFAQAGPDFVDARRGALEIQYTRLEQALQP